MTQRHCVARNSIEMGDGIGGRRGVRWVSGGRQRERKGCAHITHTKYRPFSIFVFFSSFFSVQLSCSRTAPGAYILHFAIVSLLYVYFVFIFLDFPRAHWTVSKSRTSSDPFSLLAVFFENEWKGLIDYTGDYKWDCVFRLLALFVKDFGALRFIDFIMLGSHKWEDKSMQDTSERNSGGRKDREGEREIDREHNKQI